MLHQVGVSFDLYYDARKHKIKIKQDLSVKPNKVRKQSVETKTTSLKCAQWLLFQKNRYFSKGTVLVTILC